ncbi:kynureninase [Klebsormidium nitens]|uniref:Kynureninase n=1 Tax=Klebsormidium nitens TaxID=105231 RepID=A0A1Y1I3M4_KLENI|nr:kynureninase [Klebsormidium nitens]|eukprot:GAQ84552.1 kynureninase [Klebsormidium nitens]
MVTVPELTHTQFLLASSLDTTTRLLGTMVVFNMADLKLAPKEGDSFDTSQAYAEGLDKQDSLAAKREEFAINGEELIYVDGNSLGRLPKRTMPVIQNRVEREWGEKLIRSWGSCGWYETSTRVGGKIAQMVGARSNEVIACDSTSVNLFKLILAALALRPGRTKIVTDTLNFPSDIYVIEGCINLLGNRHALQLVPSHDNDLTVDMETLEAAVDDTTALVLLSHVVFKSGFMYDGRAVTELAHKAGALVLWDLSHAAGAVPVALNEWNADFAVGCGYKYLNGGPGATAFLYVREDLQDQCSSPIWGWFGQSRPFDFATSYTPAKGMARFLAGSPPLLQLAAVEAGVDVIKEVGMEALRAKSLQLSEYLIKLADERLSPLGYSVGTPRDPAQRGSHSRTTSASGSRRSIPRLQRCGTWSSGSVERWRRSCTSSTLSTDLPLLDPTAIVQRRGQCGNSMILVASGRFGS